MFYTFAGIKCKLHGVYEVIAGGLPLRCRCCALLLGDLWCFACFAGPPLPFIPFGGLLLTTPMSWGDCSASAGLLAYMDALLAELMLSASPTMSAFASTGCARGPRASDVAEGLLVSSAHQSNTHQKFTRHRPQILLHSPEQWLSQMLHYSGYP